MLCVETVSDPSVLYLPYCTLLKDVSMKMFLKGWALEKILAMWGEEKCILGIFCSPVF